MTEGEARQCVEEIKKHLGAARALLFDLYEREGWRSLGYDSWRNCVTSEFGKHESYLYRQLAAARIEARLGGEIGAIPESHIRAIREIISLDDEQWVVRIYEEASANGAETATDYKRYARDTWLSESLPPGGSLRRSWRAGTISSKDAYEILELMINSASTDNHWNEVVDVLDHVRDARAAERLLQISRAMPTLWKQIVDSKSIPGVEESIPLEDATFGQVEAIVVLDNAERRAQIVERNRDKYGEIRRIEAEVFKLVKGMVEAVLKIDPENDLALSLRSKMNRIKELRDEVNRGD